MRITSIYVLFVAFAVYVEMVDRSLTDGFAESICFDVVILIVIANFGVSLYNCYTQ